MTYQETENTAQKDNTSEDFESMLDESMKNLNTKLKKGDVVTGKITGINESHIIISVGVKQDAYAEIGDYMEGGKLPYQVGDDIKGFIVRMDDDQIVVSKSLNRMHGNKVLIRDAYNKNIPVRGKVMESIKGGYYVDVLGMRAFCPVSHIDYNVTEKPDFYINNQFDFEIMEMDKQNIILSRRNLLAKEFEERRDKFFAKVKVGDVLRGTVVRTIIYGAFIELGGFEGLLHISEISWDHIDRADSVLKIGDEIDVKIIKIESDRISLSIKALTENPVIQAMTKYHIGDVVKCKVLRHEKFGSFVEIEKGVEGLIPISLMSTKRVHKPSEFLTVGDEIEARIVKFDEASHKISLSLKEFSLNQWDSEAAELQQGQELTGKIENVSEHGAFIKINNSLTGLIPQTKLRRAKLDLSKDNIGEEIEVRISSIDPQMQRLSLEPTSLPPYEPRRTERSERPERREFKETREFKEPREPRRGKEPRKSNKDHTQDSDWQKYATNYQSVPEDNPFNNL